MTVFDVAVIAIVLLSALLGWWRGLVYEMLSLAGWIGAYFAAIQFAPMLAPRMPDSLGEDSTKLLAACVVIFVAVLIVVGIVAWLLSKAVKLTGLGGLDASLGLTFGVARGALAVLALVLLAGLTDIPQQPFWRDAKLSAPLVQVVLMVKESLPSGVARQLNY